MFPRSRNCTISYIYNPLLRQTSQVCKPRCSHQQPTAHSTQPTANSPQPAANSPQPGKQSSSCVSSDKSSLQTLLFARSRNCTISYIYNPLLRQTSQVCKPCCCSHQQPTAHNQQPGKQSSNCLWIAGLKMGWWGPARRA